MKTLYAVIVVGMIVLALGVVARRGEGAKPDPETHKTLTLKLAEGVEMKLVLIPAGKFTMGSPADEKGRNKDETQHEVTITKPFYMGQTHVTVDQFAAFVKDSGYKTDAEKHGFSMSTQIRDGRAYLGNVNGASWRNPGFGQNGYHPVVQVSWYDATAFCDWLSKKSGKAVRLPTEAEWEYACRAGTKTMCPWGDNPDDGKVWANCGDQAYKAKLPNAPGDWLSFSCDDGFAFTSPVGSFKSSAFGLHDMIGNALQWCGDWYGDYEKSAATDPAGAKRGDFRVARGCSWADNPSGCRSAARYHYWPVMRCNTIGFRVACAAGVD